VPPGENVLILDGPRCAEGSTWWLVRSLDGLEGWTSAGNATANRLVEPISAWYPLPAAMQPGSAKTYDLREIRISAGASLVSGVEETYNPLATPFPTPATSETPLPDNPRAGINASWANYAAHSFYHFSGAIDGYMWVYDIHFWLPSL
jgi:hypothetical protein